jgi:hypothetical protein
MPESRLEQWQQLLDYSRSMLDKAEAGEWESLTAMADERRSRLEAFFAEPVPVELADTVAVGIHRIGDIDAAISAFAKEASKQFASEHGLLKKRQQANQAYSDPQHSER